MKTIFKILLVIFFLSFFALYANAADTLNPCWDMFYPHWPDKGYFNPDSVLYDTCQCKSYEKFQCTYLYARRWYEIEFYNEDPYNLPEYPHDTIIEKTWQEIDTSYVELRNMFQNVESIFGPFILRKRFPDEVNPYKPSSRVYLIKFQNYCKIDSVINFIDTLGIVNDFHYRNALFRDDTYGVDDFSSSNLKVQLYPNPAKDFIKIEFQNQLISGKIQIISLEGIIILETEYKEFIDISNLSTGVYFIRYADIVRKFIVYR